MEKMVKKTGICFLLISCMFIFLAKPCLAITLMIEEEALKFVFPEVDNIDIETRVITDIQKEKIRTKLGGKLVEHQRGIEAARIMNQREFVFYFGIKDGKRVGVAIILEEPGKWGPIEYIIKLDLEGKVGDMAVMSYTETRGRPIARRSFLKQFIGKTSRDSFRLRKDITAISGATISSGATALIVHKAIVLYEELFLLK